MEQSWRNRHLIYGSSELVLLAGQAQYELRYDLVEGRPHVKKKGSRAEAASFLCPDPASNPMGGHIRALPLEAPALRIGQASFQTTPDLGPKKL
eukprot:4241298-Pyramimonas_sp.AAC.1